MQMRGRGALDCRRIVMEDTSNPSAAPTRREPPPARSWSAAFATLGLPPDTFKSNHITSTRFR